jgi:hypothetical protein
VCVKAADGAALTGRGANGRNPMALWGERGPLRIIIIIIGPGTLRPPAAADRRAHQRLVLHQQGPHRHERGGRHRQLPAWGRHQHQCTGTQLLPRNQHDIVLQHSRLQNREP